MAIKRPETVDLIDALISQMTFNLTGTSEWLDNGDGTYTIDLCKTYWLNVVDGSSRTYTFDGYTLVGVVKNTSITVSGTSMPTSKVIPIREPNYFHGTVTDTNGELNLKTTNSDKVPLAYLLEPFEETYYGINSQLDRSSTIRMFFLDEANFSGWKTDEHYENVVNPMREMVNYFVDEVANKTSWINEIEEFSTTDRVRFGVYVSEKGNEKTIFDSHLTGIELRITLDIRKNGIECYC